GADSSTSDGVVLPVGALSMKIAAPGGSLDTESSRGLARSFAVILSWPPLIVTTSATEPGAEILALYGWSLSSLACNGAAPAWPVPSATTVAFATFAAISASTSGPFGGGGAALPALALPALPGLSGVAALPGAAALPGLTSSLPAGALPVPGWWATSVPVG